MAASGDHKVAGTESGVQADSSVALSRDNCRVPLSPLSQLLHALDDPDNLEFPAGYDHRRTRARFEQLALRLNSDFAGRCQVDREVQDASLHGRIDIPAEATATSRPLVVSISNFGNLAALSVDNPGAWTDAEAAGLLHPHDADRIHPALTDLGYTLIPEEPLWEPYDGAWDPAVFGPSAATWWIRYFDYL
jgi:hypothetical protein